MELDETEMNLTTGVESVWQLQHHLHTVLLPRSLTSIHINIKNRIKSPENVGKKLWGMVLIWAIDYV